MRNHRLKAFSLALATVAATSALAPAVAPAEDLPVRNTVVAGPAAFATGFATRQVVVLEGEGLDFRSIDLAPHTVTAKRRNGDGIPIFGSAEVRNGTTAPQAAVARVNGVADLAPGEYQFNCKIHGDAMLGTLTVVDR